MLRDDSRDVDGFSGSHVIRSESAIDLTNAVSDFYKYGKKEAFQVIQKRGESSLPEKIILHTRRRNYPIKTANFVQHSKKIKTLAEANDLPRIVDLTSYNVESVRCFVDFISGVEMRSYRTNPAILLDLLHLARIFHMKNLISTIIKEVAASIDSTEPIGHTLILNLSLIVEDWSLASDDNFRRLLLAVAADAFPQMWRLSTFRKLPLAVLQILLSRCDLDVADEAETVQVSLIWLGHAPRTEEQVATIARTIRTPMIPKNKMATVLEKIKKSNLNEKCAKIFEDVLKSDRNQRCCLIKEHLRMEFKRCGIPNSDSKFFDVGHLDLTVKKVQKIEITVDDETGSEKQKSDSSLEFRNLTIKETEQIVANPTQISKKKVENVKVENKKKETNPKDVVPSQKTFYQTISTQFPHLPAPPQISK